MRARSTIVGFAVLTILLTAGAAQSLSGTDSVFTDDITDGNVTTQDIRENAVSSSRILNGGVSGSDVANNSLTGADISGSAPGLKKVFVTRVRANGTKISGDAISAARADTLLPSGSYQLQFSFPVGSCAALATAGDKKVNDATDGNHDTLGQVISVRLAAGGPNGVEVTSVHEGTSNTLETVDSAFTLVLLCP